jgi:preprotein translocase subunit SecF
MIPKTNIDFVKKRFIFFAISGLITLTGIVSLSIKGFNMGLDFTGGTLLQVKFEKPADISLVRKALDAAGVDASLQTFDGEKSFAVKVKGRQENVNEIANKITGALKTMEGNAFSEERREYVGPVVGRDLSRKAVFAIILSMFGIIVYVAFRFSNPVWGATGIIAVIHDIFVALTVLSILGRELDLVVVAALLTLAGYSINDTIVIFDRIRETMKLHPKMHLGELINRSLNETLSRTIITSLTVLFVLTILFLFGGDVLNTFALTMLIGCITGIYSTVAIATNLVYQWEGKGR